MSNEDIASPFVLVPVSVAKDLRDYLRACAEENREDPDDSADLLDEIERAIDFPALPRVALYVEGGVVQGVTANVPLVLTTADCDCFENCASNVEGECDPEETLADRQDHALVRADYKRYLSLPLAIGSV